MKLTVIGGASSYTPELVDGLLGHLETLPLREVCLMDPNSERLEITTGLARRMSARHGNPFEVRSTSRLDEAVDGASYVVTQIRVGGSQARIRDERLAKSHGLLGQETTGLGGFACALRTIPAVLEVARAMESHSPDGMLLNFTNPAGLVTEALIKATPIESIGLCNIPIGILFDVGEAVNCSIEDVTLDYVGLNHLSWVKRFFVRGEDRSEEILGLFIEKASEEWEDPAVCAAMITSMKSLGMFCNYYLQYYYSPDETLRVFLDKDKTRGEEVVEIEEGLFKKYQDPEIDEKPAELSQRGGAHYSTAALRLIDAIQKDSGEVQIVCCKNDGAIPSLDADACVEVPAVIRHSGAKAIAQEEPPEAIRGLLHSVKAYESLTVKAAIEGDAEAAFQAMLQHPLLPGATVCKSLLKEVLDMNRGYLVPSCA